MALRLQKGPVPPRWGRPPCQEPLVVRKSLRLSARNLAYLRTLAASHQLPLATYLRRRILGRPAAGNPLTNRLAHIELARVAANLTQLRRAHLRRPFPSVNDADSFWQLPDQVAELRARLLDPPRLPIPSNLGFNPDDRPKPHIVVIRFREQDPIPSPLIRDLVTGQAFVYKSIASATRGALFRAGMILNRLAHRSNAGRLHDLPANFLEDLRMVLTAALEDL